MNRASQATRLITNPVEWLFIALALAFTLSAGLLPYPGDFLLKVSPILCLVIAVTMAGSGGKQRLILAALVFSGVGDVTLEWDLFTVGLGAFLIGHLCYLAAFCRRLKPTRPGIVAIVGLLAYATALITCLAPSLGEMLVPVCLYMGVIFAMAMAAISGRDNHALVALGAVLFVFSDSLIAINRFLQPVPGAKYWIMLLYYGAQYLLTYDARRSPAASRSSP